VTTREIDPRHFDLDKVPTDQSILPETLTVVFDVWVARYMGAEDPDAELRKHGFHLIADALKAATTEGKGN
jgi:hypothetical protein